MFGFTQTDRGFGVSGFGVPVAPVPARAVAAFATAPDTDHRILPLQPPVFLSQTGSLSMTVPFRSHLTQNAITAAALRLPVSGTTLAGFENLSARFSQEPTDHQGAHPAFLSALTFFRDDRRHRVFGAARNHVIGVKNVH